MARPKHTRPKKAITVSLGDEYIKMFELIPGDQDFITGSRKYGRRNEHIQAALSEYFKKHHEALWNHVRNRETI